MCAPTRGACIISSQGALVGLVRLLVALLPVAASLLLLLVVAVSRGIGKGQGPISASSPSYFSSEEKAWPSSG
jgi:hypothetical protein